VRRPRRPFGPANRRRQPTSPPPPRAAYDRCTPPVISDLPCPSRTRPRVRLAAAAESVLHTPPPCGPHAKEPRPGYLSRPLPPGSPTQDARRPPHLAPRPRRNPSAAAFDSLPPPSFRRREAARELRLEVSKMPVLFVVGLVPPVALTTSPEFAPRAAAPSALAAASPPRPPP
jgi:hypothetical protein